jgi:hypothetical protein
MRQGLLLGFAALAVGFAMTSAADAAMCGRSCNNGGRYIPGPPDVCAANGLNYCGSSRGGGGGAYVAPPSVTIGPGGVGITGPQVYGGGGNCRTVTIQRDDGSVRRIRRCD